MRRILIDATSGPSEGMHVLIDLLQTEAMKNGSTRIIVLGPDNISGEVRVAQGRVLGVNAGDAVDAEALRNMLKWHINELQVQDLPPYAESAQELSTCCPVDQLLLEIAESIPGLKNEDSKAIEEKDMTIEEKLGGVLRSMVDNLGGVDAAILVDSEGFVMASHGANIGNENEIEMIGGITTSLLTMTARAAGVLGTGKVDRIMLHATDRHVFVSPVYTGINLVTIAKKDASLGLIFAELRNISGDIRDMMGRG